VLVSTGICNYQYIAGGERRFGLGRLRNQRQERLHQTMAEVKAVSVGETRQATAKIYVPKIELGTAFFSAKREGLYYHSDPRKTWQRKILPELNRVQRHNEHFKTNDDKQIDAIVFPELSVPQACIEDLAAWSRDNEIVVIGGSHYEKANDEWHSVCPVIFNGQVHKTYKIVPSPYENSGVDDRGLQPGPELLKFSNTRMGNFVVFICSDYLDNDVHHELVGDDTDIVFVIACQMGVDRHYTRAVLDCQNSKRGVYVVYSNLKFAKYGEGKSALFGQVHKDLEHNFKRLGYSDLQPREKLWWSSSHFPSMILSLNLNERRPLAPKTVSTRANASLIVPYDYKPRGTDVVDGAFEERAFKLVAFDLDGTLIRSNGHHYSWAAVWQELAGDAEGLQWRALMRRFMRGEIDYVQWCNIAAEEFNKKGITASQIIDLAKKFTLVKNCGNVLKRLKDEGYKLALISGGIDLFLKAHPEIDRTLFDYLDINKLAFDETLTVVSVIATSYDFEGKRTRILEICEAEGISPEDVVYVGDSINDKSLLKTVGCFIGFPANDGEIIFAANVTIEGNDLEDVYRFIQKGKPGINPS
jgi:HAD superfamily phosphoserine phosphatase-like hydrolase